MLTNYVSEEDVFRMYSIRHFAEGGALAEKIPAAVYLLGQDLRRKGLDSTRVQPPLMFDGIGAYASTTATADVTSTAINGGNQSRFVFHVSGGSGSVVLYGSQDGTTWHVVRNLIGTPMEFMINESKIYTDLFFEKFRQYKYVFTWTDDCTYSAYLVDSSVDMLIAAKAVMLLLTPALERENTTATEIYRVAQIDYDTGLARLVLDIDADGDGLAESTDDAGTNLGYRITSYAMR